ncbi:hypothetical protein L917_14846 [Phytophthora nicotianae]|uniref:Uncharacterized protein n=1 Tax=Phytophthora nicotianae TaxID=4792 RepID=W2KMV8_PHYNI|nr:hypothetical protein L917_14846 [Phytophthora nicotianae]
MGDAVDDNCEWLKYHQPATDLYGKLYWTSDTDGTKAEPGGHSGTCNGERNVSETHELDELDELDDSRWSLRRQAPVTNWTKWTDGTDGGTGNRLCTVAW